MRWLPALALLALLAWPAQGAPAFPVALARVDAQVRVIATVPVGAVEVCVAAGTQDRCVAGSPGAAVELTIPAHGGQQLTVWAGDRPYRVGGVQTVIALVQLLAPGVSVFLPAVATP